MARQFSTGTKFGSEKGKVQKPARIPPQTPPAGGKKAEAGQFLFLRKIVCHAESKLVFRIFVKKCSNFVQKTPPSSAYLFCGSAYDRSGTEISVDKGYSIEYSGYFGRSVWRGNSNSAGGYGVSFEGRLVQDLSAR